MQWRGSTNKSPTKLNATEIKFGTGDLFTNGENHQDKTLPSNFKLTTLKNPLINNQAITSKRNLSNYLWPIPNYQPTVESSLQYPIGLDLVVAFFPTWLTNDAQILVHD